MSEFFRSGSETEFHPSKKGGMMQESGHLAARRLTRRVGSPQRPSPPEALLFLLLIHHPLAESPTTEQPHPYTCNTTSRTYHRLGLTSPADGEVFPADSDPWEQWPPVPRARPRSWTRADRPRGRCSLQLSCFNVPMHYGYTRSREWFEVFHPGEEVAF